MVVTDRDRHLEARRLALAIATSTALLGSLKASSPKSEMQLVAGIDVLTQDLRKVVADIRSAVIADVANATTVRSAALELGLSPAAVSKAVARSRSDA